MARFRHVAAVIELPRPDRTLGSDSAHGRSARLARWFLRHRGCCSACRGDDLSTVRAQNAGPPLGERRITRVQGYLDVAQAQGGPQVVRNGQAGMPHPGGVALQMVGKSYSAFRQPTSPSAFFLPDISNPL